MARTTRPITNTEAKQAQPYTKKRTSLSFGSYPQVSIIDARGHIVIRSRERLARTAKENTLEVISRNWLLVKKTKVSQDHAGKLFRSLEIHILPQLGRVPIDEIRAPTVIDTLKPLAAKGNLETLRRVCQRLNEVMHYAVNSGLIAGNPIVKISDVFESPTKQHMGNRSF